MFDKCYNTLPLEARGTIHINIYIYKKKLDLTDKLGKDRKLMPKEHQCCIDGGLFLLCAVKGHMIKDCLDTT